VANLVLLPIYTKAPIFLKKTSMRKSQRFTFMNNSISSTEIRNLFLCVT